MIDIKKVSQNFFSQKKNIIIMIVILVIVLILVGVYFYSKPKVSLTPEQEMEMIFQKAALDAASVNLTEEERVDAMNKALAKPGAVLPKEEAKIRDRQIINTIYE